MSDAVKARSFNVGSCRQILAQPGPPSPQKLHAAQFFAAMDRVERWWLWLIPDLAVVAAGLAAPIFYARLAVGLYAAAYAISTSRPRLEREASKLLAEMNELAADEREERFLALADRVGRLFTAVMAAAMVASGAVMLVLPAEAFRAIMTGFAVLIARHLYRVLSTHRRMVAVLRDSRNEPWYPGYMASHDQHVATVADRRRAPDGC